MAFVMLTEVQAQAVDWLIPGRLARGHLHLLDGDPGLGKSLVLLDLAASLTTGRPFAGCATGVPPTSVVLLNAEDGAHDTIAPRLQAAGADASRVAFFDRKPGESSFRLPGQVELLADIVSAKQASLVVLDPLLGFLDPTVNIGSDLHVRQALLPLADLARAHQCALVMLRHLNKQRGGRALYRGLASIAFMAACRIAWFIGPDPKVPRRYVLAQSKNNLDQPPPSLAYRIVGESRETARIEWVGESVWTDGDLLRADTARLQARARARDLVERILKDGPLPVARIMKSARDLGLSQRTVQRAAKDAKVRHQRVILPNKAQLTYWLLPGQELPAELQPPAWAEVAAWLHRLEQQDPSLADEDPRCRPDQE